MSKLTDEMLREALMRLQDIEMSEMPDEDELDIEFSPWFEKKMRKLIRKTDHKVQYYLQRVACVILAFALGGTLYLTINTDARAQFFGWVREQFVHFEHYFYEGPTSETLLDDVEYRPTWLPEGYVESNVVKTNTGTTVFYVNGRGSTIRFHYNETPIAKHVFLDTDNMTYRVSKIDGYTIDFYVPNDSTIAPSIIWENDKGMSFLVSGFLSEEELMEIAKNVA